MCKGLERLPGGPAGRTWQPQLANFSEFSPLAAQTLISLGSCTTFVDTPAGFLNSPGFLLYRGVTVLLSIQPPPHCMRVRTTRGLRGGAFEHENKEKQTCLGWPGALSTRAWSSLAAGYRPRLFRPAGNAAAEDGPAGGGVCATTGLPSVWGVGWGVCALAGERKRPLREKLFANDRWAQRAGELIACFRRGDD